MILKNTFSGTRIKGGGDGVVRELNNLLKEMYILDEENTECSVINSKFCFWHG